MDVRVACVLFMLFLLMIRLSFFCCCCCLSKSTRQVYIKKSLLMSSCHWDRFNNDLFVYLQCHFVFGQVFYGVTSLHPPLKTQNMTENVKNKAAVDMLGAFTSPNWCPVFIWQQVSLWLLFVSFLVCRIMQKLFLHCHRCLFYCVYTVTNRQTYKSNQTLLYSPWFFSFVIGVTSWHLPRNIRCTFPFKLLSENSYSQWYDQINNK